MKRILKITIPLAAILLTNCKSKSSDPVPPESSLKGKVLYVGDFAGGGITEISNPDNNAQEKNFFSVAHPNNQVWWLTLDKKNKKVYWNRTADLDGLVPGIYSGDLDGPNKGKYQLVTADNLFVLCMTINGDYMYWVLSAQDHIVKRSDLDGGNTIDYLVTDQNNFIYTLCMTANTTLYYGTWFQNEIGKAVNGVVEDESFMQGYSVLDIEVYNNEIYFLDTIDGSIKKADLNGQNVSTVVQAGGAYYSFEIDENENTVYFGTPGTQNNFYSVARQSLNGGNPTIVATDLSSNEICLDLEDF